MSPKVIAACPGLACAAKRPREDVWTRIKTCGLAGDITILDRLTIGAEGAYLPLGRFNGYDTHWLRLGSTFNGPTPETGSVKGFETEVTLAYRVTEALRVDIGARYWYFRSANATEQFDQSVTGGSPQPVDRRDNRYGVFAGASWTF